MWQKVADMTYEPAGVTDLEILADRLDSPNSKIVIQPHIMGGWFGKNWQPRKVRIQDNTILFEVWADSEEKEHKWVDFDKEPPNFSDIDLSFLRIESNEPAARFWNKATHSLEKQIRKWYSEQK